MLRADSRAGWKSASLAVFAAVMSLMLTACDSPDDFDPAQSTPSIGCGPTVCRPPKNFAGVLCCRSHFDGICGQMFAGTCTDLPPEPHANCEGARIPMGGAPLTVPGCCTNTNECGIVFSSIACVSLTQARLLGDRFATGIDRDEYLRSLPEPRTCDGVPLSPAPAGSGG